MVIRLLSTFEKAAVISNEYAPFNVVVSVHLENGPTPKILTDAITSLQKDHQLLRAHIRNEGKKLWFEELSTPREIPLIIIERAKEEQWKTIVEQEMAHQFPPSGTPLIRFTYLPSQNQSELILTAHHALLDGASAAYLLDALLSLCTGIEPSNKRILSMRNQQDVLPPSHKGVKQLLQLGRFGLSQMAGEFSYHIKNIGKRIPQVHHGGEGKIISISLTQNLTSSLARRARRKRVTLNSLLNAAQLLAVNKILYAGNKAAMQTFSFADLRPYLTPPIPAETLGGWVTLFRIPISLSGTTDFWNLTKNLHSKITIALKRGDKFNAFLTSAGLLKMMTRMDKFRFGSSAINYSGVIPINPQYGNIQVNSIHGFVSAYDLAPEFSSQARIFNNQIIWDFIYLDTDMDNLTAIQLVQEITNILENAVS